MNQSNWLKTWREKEELTDVEASIMIGVSLKTYRSWEAGKPMSEALVFLVVAVQLMFADDPKLYAAYRVNKMKILKMVRGEKA
jgi:DNA-binding XRE family transcriptional regulator